MRYALWLFFWFVLAVALALFTGSNGATVALYWPPYRMDMSLNLVVLLVLLLVVVVHLAWQSVAGLLELPRRALQWRILQKDKSMQQALQKAQSNLLAGRYTRAATAARQALGFAADLQTKRPGDASLATVRALGHLTASRSAHYLRDTKGREMHIAKAIALAQASSESELKDGALLQAASWALQDNDASMALDYLSQVTPGAARRTYGLKIRLRADQMAGKVGHALETARLLTKHNAFTPEASASLLRGLAQQVLRQSHDMAQLGQTWQRLSTQEQAQMALASVALERVSQLEGPSSMARHWLLPAWDSLMGGAMQGVTDQEDFTHLILALQPHVSGLEPQWLARIEKAQLSHPQNAALTYLAGIACLERQLWGKAESLLAQATPHLRDKRLAREAWRALAALAELRDQNELAAQHYKKAALLE